ncbi:signal transduction histidine kinase [Anaerosolibacter carboniphilus]|uniref:histidine kinase n=1 Tax=Anaerosolibacter carboniphilus TaxID=1417629 RepID=A0A841KPI8_9FIRM|nr:ATP-binding protein [Anaerosolibacter carboniphilus]MBB6215231.1 signal transduction histidine kinase [Anaerosolibacter carboniphilus]
MKGIHSKLWLAITSLVITILIIIWLFQVGLLNKFYIHERKSVLSNEAQKLNAILLEADQENMISEKVIEEVEAFTSSVNARVIILDQSGEARFFNILDRYFIKAGEFDRAQSRTLGPLLGDKEIRSKLAQNQPFTVVRKKPQSHDASIYVGVPVIRENKKIGDIIISSPLAPIEETISILKKQLTYVSIFSLGIGTLLALYLARIFTKPILNIIEASKEIAKGNFTAKVSHRSDDEIGVLGETINDMAQQLDRIEQLRKEFIANISHELKTPISLIKAYAELVKEVENISTDDKNQYLEVITEESDRLNGMIEDILYLSKIQAGFSNLTYDQIFLKDLIHGVIEKLSYFAQHKNIEITVETHKENISVYADKDKMYQVFYNIINNAIQHSYENTKIWVKTLETDHGLKVEVIDNGKGIAEEDLPYIWDRFYKVDKSGKRNDSGTGLGMAIVKNILEAHHMKYGVESQLHKGTKVWMEMRLEDKNQ